MIEDWQHFLLPYQQAVNELKVKLRGMRKQFQDQTQHSPIEFVTGRVKPVDSIKEKMINHSRQYHTPQNCPQAYHQCLPTNCIQIIQNILIVSDSYSQ